MDPRTGEVLAMVGGNDYNRPGGQINMAVSPRQPGSSFKMFTYTAAIESRQVNMTTPSSSMAAFARMRAAFGSSNATAVPKARMAIHAGEPRNIRIANTS